jgi:two-component system nitrogen regulation sensor histidine kinase NtrY
VGKVLRIVVLQNIQPELQQKEIEAWQNLTRVLRHEIMNSLTPILSLVGTMKEIVQLDIAPEIPENEGLQDLTGSTSNVGKTQCRDYPIRKCVSRFYYPCQSLFL